MDELLAKYMLGEANAAEIEVIDKWIFSSEDNLKYFTHFKLIWEMSKELKTESTLNVDDSWAEFKQMTEQPVAVAPIIKSLNTQRQWIKIAAIWLVILSVAAVFLTLYLPGKPKMLTLQTFNNVKIDTLSDGSIITLNKNSIFTYPEKFSGDLRSVKLNTGEAFFDIAHDKSKPFIIHINDAEVKVVGTSFNIKNSKSYAEIIVESGIVQIIHKKVIVRLKPREKAEIDFEGGKMTTGKSTDYLYKYYRTQELVANKTPLWRVVKVLNSIYQVQIEIPDKKLANQTLSTTFKLDSLDKILNVIADTFKVRIVRQSGKILIK